MKRKTKEAGSAKEEKVERNRVDRLTFSNSATWKSIPGVASKVETSKS